MANLYCEKCLRFFSVNNVRDDGSFLHQVNPDEVGFCPFCGGEIFLQSADPDSESE